MIDKNLGFFNFLKMDSVMEENNKLKKEIDKLKKENFELKHKLDQVKEILK